MRPVTFRIPRTQRDISQCSPEGECSIDHDDPLPLHVGAGLKDVSLDDRLSTQLLLEYAIT